MLSCCQRRASAAPVSGSRISIHRSLAPRLRTLAAILVPSQAERTETGPVVSDASVESDHPVDDFARIALEQNAAAQRQILEGQNTLADTLKTIREAIGVDTIVGPNNMDAYIKAATQVSAAMDVGPATEASARVDVGRVT